jgi:hypothetical protein
VKDVVCVELRGIRTSKLTGVLSWLDELGGSFKLAESALSITISRNERLGGSITTRGSIEGKSKERGAVEKLEKV